jgi:hypothetical protein
MKKIALVAVAGLALATAACSKPAEDANTAADAIACDQCGVEPYSRECPSCGDLCCDVCFPTDLAECFECSAGGMP